MISLGQNHGRLCWQFRLGGKLHRVYIGMDDNRENRRTLQPRLRELRAKFAANAFDLAGEFPEYARSRGLLPPAKVSLLEYLEKLNAESKVTHETRYDRSLLIRKFLAANPIGKLPVDQVKWPVLRPFVSALTPEGTATRRVRMFLGWLSSAFEQARRDELIDANPLPRLGRLRQAKSEIDPFSAAERRQIVSVAKRQLKNLVEVLFDTGLRPNELTPLEWSDVDLGRGTLRVSKALTRFRHVALPKTQGSQRTIILRSAARKALQRQRALSELRGKLVFPDERGGCIRVANLNRRRWRSLLKQANVKYRPLKFTRHSFAVMMIEEGHPLREIAATMGHESIAMIVRHYSRWMNQEQRAQAQNEG